MLPVFNSIDVWFPKIKLHNIKKETELLPVIKKEKVFDYNIKTETLDFNEYFNVWEYSPDINNSIGVGFLRVKIYNFDLKNFDRNQQFRFFVKNKSGIFVKQMASVEFVDGTNIYLYDCNLLFKIVYDRFGD